MAETEEAVRKFLDGEEEAFSRIVRRWERKIFNLAWRMLNNREDAQDVVQETFLSVFKSLRNLRDPRGFSTWLYQITLNHCKARWRARATGLSLDDPVLDQRGEQTSAIPVSPALRSDQDSLETIDLIQKAMAGLSEEHRTAIILKEYVGLSLEELAGVMECPLSTAKSRLYHGLREVQRNLRRMGIIGTEP
jgi:RNA polymerase sigma-70 factor, ECF subfamily